VTAVVRQWWVAAVLLGVTGCLMILNNIATNTQLQTTAPDQLRGRVMGFYSLMVLGMSPFGSLLAGWVSEQHGVPAALGLGAAVCGLSVLRLAEPGRKVGT
jgi:MFS family permease